VAELAAPAGVLIVGGGVAALETMMALRALAGDRVQTTLVAPEPDFVYQPTAVLEPFGLGEAGRYPLQRITEDFGTALVRGGVAAVEPRARRVVLHAGDTLTYEHALVLAPGARTLPALDDALTFTGTESAAAMRVLLDDVGYSRVRRIAFVAPEAGWTLPLYELALLTARHAVARDLAVELILITPEPTPLAVFGDRASAAVADLLAVAGVEFSGASQVEVGEEGIRLHPKGRLLRVERVVALPLVRGPELDGVPADPDSGFIPVDEHGRVEGLDDVYCAGDATNYPIKQGGLAAQQADAVAEQIAARIGAEVTPSPFRPVLRGMLFTGDVHHYMVARGRGAGRAGRRPLWWPPTKLAGRYLAPYLHEREPGAMPGPSPEGFTDLELPLDAPGAAPAGR
jgi:sulfide:quinone oxidoreductase